jgi:hypothetical protein
VEGENKKDRRGVKKDDEMDGKRGKTRGVDATDKGERER